MMISIENAASILGGGAAGIVSMWYWLKSKKREDHKMDTVDGGWEKLVKSLQIQVDKHQALIEKQQSAIEKQQTYIERVEKDLNGLGQKYRDCERSRSILEAELSIFKKRFGEITKGL